MDLIARAMERGKHLCKDRKLTEQTWELFCQQSAGKKVFLFGTGIGMDYFLRYCCNHLGIAGIIDNNKEKQDKELGWDSAEAFQTEYEHLIIQSPDVLKKYDDQDTVVLITSVNYYVPMAEQLKQMGFTNYFSLLTLEANDRKKRPNAERKDYVEIREEYIDWCCQQKIECNKIVMRIGEYGGHAKSITNQLLKSEEKLDLVWLVRSPDEGHPAGVRLVPERNWKRYIYEMETARIWIFDAYMYGYIRKREGQIYIQTKHWSSITLKTFGLDDASTCASEENVDHLKKDGKRMDYIFSGSEFDERSCRSGLAFEGKAIRVGSARSDILFDPFVKKHVFDKLNLDMDTRALLYAPTYRDKDFRRNHSMPITLDMEGLLDVLTKKWGGKWILLVRLHPWLTFEGCGLTETENVINVGDYPESEELVAAADVMVTDYSSIMFEAAYLKRPVFLYAPDKTEYIDGERGLLLEYDTLPFPAAVSNEGLWQCISEFNKTAYEKNVTFFLNRHGVREDGHASERAAKVITDLLKGKTI